MKKFILGKFAWWRAISQDIQWLIFKLFGASFSIFVVKYIPYKDFFPFLVFMATYITKYGKTDNSGLSYIKLFGRLGNLKGLLRTKAPSILV